MAEFVMKDLVHKEGLDNLFCIESAATTAEEIWRGKGNPVYPPARKKLAEHGIRCDGKYARLFTYDDCSKFDYLIGMDNENLYDMRRTAGSAYRNKISLLMDWTGNPRNVADPWYTGNFDDTWNDVYEGCTALLEHLKDLI